MRRGFFAFAVLFLFSLDSSAGLFERLKAKRDNLKRERIRQRVLRRVGGPVQTSDFARQNDSELVELGRLLFHDKILSGNRNISCSTCHDLTLGTSDGLSMSIGEGGFGLGPFREAEEAFTRVPRNAPAIFNVGAIEFVKLFHDGRVAEDKNTPSGFSSPAGHLLPEDLDSLLAVQAMFPVTSTIEMAGQADENPVGAAASVGDVVEVWRLLALRVQEIPEYVDMFVDAFGDVDQAEDITFSHIANAIAAYEDQDFRTDQSPFDRFLAGNLQAVSNRAVNGMNLFYGVALCVRCHSGKFQTDQKFHSIGMPQFGPGTGDGIGGFEDFGRERVTGNRRDRYKFRTPSLRNVELTGPWGHTGAYATLEEMVAHYRAPRVAIRAYDRSQAILPEIDDILDFGCLGSRRCVRRIASSERVFFTPLSNRAVDDIVAFLKTLTDPRSVNMGALKPSEVPSQLPVD